MAEGMDPYLQTVSEKRKTQGVLSLEECQDILKYAADNQSDLAFGMGYYYFAEYYWFHNNQDQASYCLTECTKFFQLSNRYEYLTKAYNMLGAIADLRDNKVVALNYYYVGLQYATMYGVEYGIGLVSNNIAYLLKRVERYEEAIGYYERAIKAYEKADTTTKEQRLCNLCDAMVHIVTCYLKCEKTKQAAKQLEQALFLWEGQLKESYPRERIYVVQAEYALAKGQVQEAITYTDLALEYLVRCTSLDSIRDLLTEMADLMLRCQIHDRMEIFFQKIDELGLEQIPMLLSNLYPYRRQFLLQSDRNTDYIKYTKEYFTRYENAKINNMQEEARLMDLQDSLRELEEEQERIQTFNKRLEEIALYDSLTKLANRTLINEIISTEIEAAKQEEKFIGIEFLDIDYFKQYNDTYGHMQGDWCLEQVAAVLEEISDENVFCGRYGGDEFVIVYRNMTEKEIEEKVKKIQELIRSKRIPHKNSKCMDYVTLSQGILYCKPAQTSREWDLCSAADGALYQAKKRGRNCYFIVTEVQNENKEG